MYGSVIGSRWRRIAPRLAHNTPRYSDEMLARSDFSRGAPTKYTVLGAERQSSKQRLRPAQECERAREIEEKVRAFDRQPVDVHQPPRDRWRERDRVAVEQDTAHDDPRTRIPGIVLPEGERTVARQHPEDLLEGDAPIGRTNVMEDAVRVDHVCAPVRQLGELRSREEADSLRGVLAARARDRARRNVATDDVGIRECGREQDGGRAVSAAKIKDASDDAPPERAPDVVDPPSRNEVARLAGYREAPVH